MRNVKSTGAAVAPSIDPNEAAFQQTEAHRAALDLGAVFQPRGLDPERAANFGIDLGIRLTDPEWRARFALLSAKTFDPSLLDRLLPAARAVAWARALMSDRLAGERAARLPTGLVQEATKLREAMLKLASYHLSADPVAGPIIADIRQGSGYEDLAQDLERTAKLYGQFQGVLSKDPYFNAGDPSRAQDLAAQVRKELGAGASAKQNQAQQDADRAWTLFALTYDEVAAAGRFLWRKEKGEEIFPSLFQVARASKRAGAATPPPAPSPAGPGSALAQR